VCKALEFSNLFIRVNGRLVGQVETNKKLFTFFKSGSSNGVVSKGLVKQMQSFTISSAEADCPYEK